MFHKVFHLTQKLKPFNKVNKRKLLTVRWSPCVSVIAGEKFNNAGDDFCLKLLVKKWNSWEMAYIVDQQNENVIMNLCVQLFAYFEHWS